MRVFRNILIVLICLAGAGAGVCALCTTRRRRHPAR